MVARGHMVEVGRQVDVASGKKKGMRDFCGGGASLCLDCITIIITTTMPRCTACRNLIP